MPSKKKKNKSSKTSAAVNGKKVGFDLRAAPPAEAPNAQQQQQQPLVPTRRSAPPSTFPTAPLTATTTQQQGVLSKGQLSIVILLSLGISRLMQIASVTSSNEPSSCHTYLPEELCHDDHVLLLLQYKYYTAIQTLMTVTSMIAILWHHERLLLLFNASLVPVLMALAVALGLSPLSRQVRGTNMLMCAVVAVLVVPTDYDTIPLVGTQRYHRRHKSLQSLTLFTLALRKFLHAYQTPHLQEWFLYDSTNIHSACWNVWYFVQVDWLTQGVVAMFGWYYLNPAAQRTLLWNLALLASMEYWYQFPRLQHDMHLPWTECGVTVLACAVAWAAPPMSGESIITTQPRENNHNTNHNTNHNE